MVVVAKNVALKNVVAENLCALTLCHVVASGYDGVHKISTCLSSCLQMAWCSLALLPQGY